MICRALRGWRWQERLDVLPDGPAARGAVPSGRSIRFAVVLPLVAIEDYADQREEDAKRITCHEVTVVRAGRF